MTMIKKISVWVSVIIFITLLIFIYQTYHAIYPSPAHLSVTDSDIHKLQILDRDSQPLTITYQNKWNIHDYKPLHDIPETLQHIFVIAEDKRFFQHQGADWTARFHAMWQNIKSLEVVRGASTITEQVVRILRPRPRTFWSRWIEGFEATQLENNFSKADILEFYLNQVPYASQRRGVVQAARHYFDRDLETLSLKEMLALAVLVRSPSRLDLKRGTKEIQRPIKALAQRLVKLNLITQKEYNEILQIPLALNDSTLPVQATHFVNYIYRTQAVEKFQKTGRLHTTLSTSLQRKTQEILDTHLHDLQHKNVQHGAVLIVDHHNNEILAWVNAGQLDDDKLASHIDAIITPRQPGSTLKPFLYALALEKGWTAATLINDSPLAESVGTGLHSYRNYSRHHYGFLRLRDALGNSLNIPAVRAIQFIGIPQFLQHLHKLGMTSLDAHPDFYGDGLALGNGGITLLELVQAYATLANQGRFQPVKSLSTMPQRPVINAFSPEVSSIIADILSDPDARRLEFGSGTLLRFPVQTAVKTGTSNDYHDAWALGFNHRYTVGIWIGNLDQQPMRKVSGASGAALILRSVFAELNRLTKTQPLYLSPNLVNIEICRDTGLPATKNCPSRSEWFVKGTEPVATKIKTVQVDMPLFLRQPIANLQLAMDPRIPDEYEAFMLVLSDARLEQADSIEWYMDGEVIGTTAIDERQFLWQLEKGKHVAQARILNDEKWVNKTPKVIFYVK